MSLSTEQPPESELDHIRDTLTGIISYASKTRSEMHQRFDQQEKRFDQQDKRFDQQDKRFDQQDREIAALRADNAGLKADNAEIKATLKLILSKLDND